MHPDDDVLALIALNEPSGDPAVADHLAGCPDCRAEVDALTETAALARAADPDPAPPPPDRVWAGIAATLDLADPPTATDPPPATDPLLAKPWWRRTATLTAAASAGVLVAVGAGWLMGRAASSTGAQATVVSTADLHPLPDSPEQAAAGTARIERTGGTTQLTVEATGLPTPDGFYEVWLFDPTSGRMVPMGNLDPAQHGTFPMPPNLDPTRYPVIDISAEKYDNDPEHSETSVLRGQLSG